VLWKEHRPHRSDWAWQGWNKNTGAGSARFRKYQSQVERCIWLLSGSAHSPRVLATSLYVAPSVPVLTCVTTTGLIEVTFGGVSRADANRARSLSRGGTGKCSETPSASVARAPRPGNHICLTPPSLPDRALALVVRWRRPPRLRGALCRVFRLRLRRLRRWRRCRME